MTTITNNKLTDEEITALALKLFDGSSFYFQSGRRPGAKTMAELLNKAASAVAEPEDLSEWADMQFLLWDAQRRAGISDEQITQAMVEKLTVNKQREWPEPKDGEPRLHIKEQPAPVVPDDWVMVPKEPTRQMMAQGHFAMKGTDRGKFRRIYQAMITAAPALNKGGINAE